MHASTAFNLCTGPAHPHSVPKVKYANSRPPRGTRIETARMMLSTLTLLPFQTSPPQLSVYKSALSIRFFFSVRCFAAAMHYNLMAQQIGMHSSQSAQWKLDGSVLCRARSCSSQLRLSAVACYMKLCLRSQCSCCWLEHYLVGLGLCSVLGSMTCYLLST